MKVENLAKELANVGIPSNMYSINRDKDEHYCIVQVGMVNKTWEVYYSQRGNKDELFIFKDENEACEYFSKWISGDYLKYISRK